MDDIFKWKFAFSSRPWLDKMKILEFSVTKLRVVVLTDSEMP